MHKITSRLHKQALDKMKPMINQLVSEGVDQNKIVHTCKQYTQGKIKAYYRRLREPQHFGTCLTACMADLEARKDSNAEAVFFYLLRDKNIPFEFQYKIGPYRVDYLIGKDLVVELDGPGHDKKKDERRDKYLEKMGYRILRIPIYILAIDQEAVIDGILEAALDKQQRGKG